VVDRQRVRPGRVVALRGVLFQYDGRDGPTSWVIHPFERLDRRAAGLKENWHARPSLPGHTGLHVAIETGAGQREMVAEQLLGGSLASIARDVLRSGLHWTPLTEVVRRDHGGWHLTIPATAFRTVDEAAVREAVERLDRMEGRPFLDEDCVAFVERAFGGRRLFADSPLFRRLGLNVRVADPALPLLRPNARLGPRAERLLQVDVLRRLPDPLDQTDGQAPRAECSWRCSASQRLWWERTSAAGPIDRDPLRLLPAPLDSPVGCPNGRWAGAHDPTQQGVTR
jgi:hypothetical protein